jgi:hypothetical protein
LLTLITGVPGSSKTLNTINEVLNSGHYDDRPVYYYNIQEVTLPWHELDEKGAKSWYELPQGSVVIMDECQRLFRPMKYGDKVPTHIEELETHRHLGIDLFLITQHPKLIDTKVRRLVGRHLHFKRQFGMESATRIEFQKCADDPLDYFEQKEAIKTKVRFPKKLYGVYKSADQHTHKKVIPKKLYFLIAVAIITAFLVYQGVSSFGEFGQAESGPRDNPVMGSPLSRGIQSEPVKSELSWAEKRVPRVADIPSSAPIYDGLTEVKSAPRPQCIINHKKDTCDCFTQQATPLQIKETSCRSYATSGYFDPTRPDPSRSGEQSSGQSEAPADGPASSAHQRNLKAMAIYADIEEKKADYY